MSYIIFKNAESLWDHPSDNEGGQVFWNNKFGWTDIEQAEIFDNEAFNNPIGGRRWYLPQP